MNTQRRVFYEPQRVCKQVDARYQAVTRMGESVDYFTFVPDGEPTLDANLGREIEMIRVLGKPVAVISNASLIDRDDVRDDLMRADWVSLKVDAASEKVWRRINRPHRSLRLPSILDGMLSFSRGFSGQLVTETILVRGVNDDATSLMELADFLSELAPSKAYLAAPTRPPAEEWVDAPTEAKVTQAFLTLVNRLPYVECLLGYEGNAFTSTGDIEEDLLGITAVHPMRRDAVAALVARAGADWTIVERLLVTGALVKTEYGGFQYFTRRIAKSKA